ncbi:unnamed protein product [Allacma fusca]|uniref:Methyltransferase type 11 domain-containing protein n=1 Tax=Allacma fusca TaxID=39272 RepID=A0A8J2NYQ8_9HEXA|nr:unnamed protein product [Allacma fusca]
MNDPDSYDAYSEFQRNDAAELVPYIVAQVHWKPSESILDFGCGSGYITKNVLLPALEANYPDGGRSVFAVDISKKMVDFASIKYQHPNITYMTVDIMKDECEFPCKFDKVFSFHVLHWIPDQRKALQILHSLMKPNGEIGFYFISNAAVFSVYDAMSKNPIWAPYLQDVQNYIPKTFYSSDSGTDMSTMLNSIGFFVHESTMFSRSFNFPSVEEMIDAAMAANPFIGRIPAEMQAAYRDNFRSEFTPFLHFAPTSESPFAIKVAYQIVLVRAQRL